MLPDYWQPDKIGEVAKLSKIKYDPKTAVENLKCIELEHIGQESGSLIGSASALSLSSIKTRFSKGDVLFGKLRPYLKKYAKPDFSGVCSTEIWVLKPMSGKITTEYLFQIVQSQTFLDAANKSCGTKMPRAEWGVVADAEIALPPIPEQKRIADVLASVDTAIEATKAVIDQIKTVKQGLLQTLLTRGIGHTKFKNSPLGEIPETWESVKFEKLAKINDGTHKTPKYVDSGVPFLRVTDIKEGAINLKNAKYITRKEHNELIKRCRPERGDILYSKNGTIGVARLVDWDWEFSVFVSLALIKIKDREYTSPDFLNVVLASNLIDNQIRNRTKQGTVSNLHLEEIREFDIPVPPEREQRDIVKICHALDSDLSVEDAKLATLKTLKKGLMNDLLTGKVRVSLLDQSEPQSSNNVVPFVKKSEPTPLRKQAVLTAEIISLLRPEWVGMTKREKTFDIIARQLGLEDALMRQPERWVAGPYDPQSRHAVDPILEAEGWVKKEVDSKGIYSFTEGANHGAHKAEFDACFSEESAEIRRIAKALRTNQSQFFEIVATLHAAWNDLKLEGKAPTNDEIIAEVYQWHDAKREIPKVDWLNGLDWIRRQHIEPNGKGKMTKAATLI